MLVFLIGIPALRYFLLAAIILGGIVALVIRWIRLRQPRAAPWIFGFTRTQSAKH
jgi:hypothetical protein